MSKRVIVLLLFVAAVGTVRAAEIRNEIKIETNTGGNSTNSQNSVIETGDTNTSININNNSEQETTTSTEIKTESTTKVDIQSSGGRTSTVEINVNKQKYSVSRENGITTLTTTDSDGETKTQVLENDQDLQVELGDSSQITISNSDSGFTLNHNQSSAKTELPVSVDTQSKRVYVTINGIEEELSLLPDQVAEYIQTNHLVDSSTDELSLNFSDNSLHYTLKGNKQIRLFRLIPVTIEKTITIPVANEASYQEYIDNPIHRLMNIVSV